jgi:hypothetical protein
MMILLLIPFSLSNDLKIYNKTALFLWSLISGGKRITVLIGRKPRVSNLPFGHIIVAAPVQFGDQFILRQ